MSENDKKTCFIIMPITTPKNVVESYGGDDKHFLHVLNCLFIPAIKAANMEPIPPISKGSEVIHADIIQNLERADLVLCDMSNLNPNVFFELGIRTALNLPISYVRDDKTKKIPFDNAIVNHYVYDSTLPIWNEDKNIQDLKNHIVECMKINNNANSLWKYFGIKAMAQEYRGQNTDSERFEILLSEVNRLGTSYKILESHINNPNKKPMKTFVKTIETKDSITLKIDRTIDDIVNELSSEVPMMSRIDSYDFEEPNILNLSIFDYEGVAFEHKLDKIAASYGLVLKIRYC